MSDLPRKLRVVTPLAVVQLAAYWLLNHYPPVPSRELPLTWLDRAVPFWTWSIWGYLALYPIAIGLPLAIRNRRVFDRMVVAYAISAGAALACFALWPTHSPRPPRPTDDSWHSIAYRWFILFDTPECCFPSLHIIVPAIVAASFWQDGRRHGLWFALPLGVVLCTLTILTTKQHYAWDLLGGYAVAAAGIVLSWRILPDEE